MITFDELRNANIQRLPLFKNAKGQVAHTLPNGGDWSIAEWTNAIAGEVGEACNIAKKIIRGDFGDPGTPEYQKAMLDLVKEFADIVIYTDIACMRAGDNLGAAVALKFNEVSRRVGCNIKLHPSGGIYANEQEKSS